MQSHDISYGFCQCGCGEKTTLVQKSEPRAGRVQGQPNRFVNGHQGRKPLRHGTRTGYNKGCRCEACLEVNRVHVRQWRIRSPEKARAAGRRGRLKYLYGLTPGDYEALVEAHGGRCAICRREKPLSVDHCHATGKIRGLLCTRCNLSIGRFNHDAEVLRRAADYLS